MKKIFGSFFQNKKILITGHTGFIGSWLSITLNELGAEVIGYALPPHTHNDNFVVSNLKDKMVSIIGDIRNFKKLNKVFNKYEPQIVFHLAAQPLVKKSYLNPKETYDINVGGTVNLFEIFRNQGSCKLMVNCTTDKVYENQELKKGYKEEDRLGGYDPYSSSKSCSELITSAYRKSFLNLETPFINKFIASVRCGNVIGGGDWQDYRLIPDCLKAIRDNQEIVIRNPNYIRPWQFVLEPIRGFLILAIKMWEDGKKYSGAWNFGPNYNNIFSVREIAEKIIDQIGKGRIKTPSQEENNKFHETELLLIDSSKAYEYLKWEPKLSIDQTISFICDWYLEEEIDYDFDVSQIKQYFQKIEN
ncbi:MAG: CDP-glucose 4,6-dehydratase [Promethearchaeota archaeon]